jgi:hypothetical protein
MWMLVLVGWLPWIVLGTAAFFLGWRAVRAIERRGTGGEEIAALWERIESLEGTVTSQERELQQILERQEFVERVVTEGRPSTPNALDDT